MYEGLGLHAAVAAACGGWTIPVHCTTGALVKIACMNDETASMVVWESEGKLLYTTMRVKRNKIYFTADGTLLRSTTIAARIFATVIHHYGHLQAPNTAQLPAFEWAPTATVLVTTAVGMAAALTTALQTRRHGELWIVDFPGNLPSASIRFGQDGVDVNRRRAATATNGTCCVARIAAALVSHHDDWHSRPACQCWRAAHA